MTANSLTNIPFHNQFIPAQQDEEGEIYVALKPICTNIGVQYEAQYHRLQRAKWAAMSIMDTTGADGKTYDMVVIDRQTFVMWLATIDTGRVKNEDAKQLIVLYQMEAAKVLERYFFGDAQPGTPDKQLLREAVEVGKRLEETMQALKDALLAAGTVNNSNPAPTQPELALPPTYTLTERWYLQQIKEHGYAIPGDCPFPDPMTAHKAMIQRFGLQTSTKRVRAAGQERKTVHRILLPTSLTPEP